LNFIQNPIEEEQGWIKGVALRILQVHGKEKENVFQVLVKLISTGRFTEMMFNTLAKNFPLKEETSSILIESFEKEKRDLRSDIIGKLKYVTNVSEEKIKKLLQILAQDQEPKVRKSVTEALGTLVKNNPVGKELIVDGLLKALTTDSDRDVIAKAATALSNSPIQKEQIMKILIQVIEKNINLENQMGIFYVVCALGIVAPNNSNAVHTLVNYFQQMHQDLLQGKTAILSEIL